MKEQKVLVFGMVTAILGATACGGEPTGDEATGESDALDVGDETKADTPVGQPERNPFNPRSCAAPAMTEAEARARFRPGSTEVDLGAYQVSYRQRRCHRATGCSPWSVGRSPSSTNFRGIVRLKTTANNKVRLHIMARGVSQCQESLTDNSSGNLDGRPVGIGKLFYAVPRNYAETNSANNWNGGTFVGPGQCSRRDFLHFGELGARESRGSALRLSGTLAKSCIRLVGYERIDRVDSAGSYQQTEAVLFARF
ncbi:MAG: hypothetical protein HYY84_13295 [Deltaproteobacteria bacterium]|nr:hypothetical protein [Deltaproteobacteria bacterium]